MLVAIGLPEAQQNERSALTLLALLNLEIEQSWSEIQAPLIGITPIMQFSHEKYGKKYAPNSRETFRRYTMHQFVDAGLAVSNPDKPDRPINSPKWVYQVAPDAYQLFKTFGTSEWSKKLTGYLECRKTLASRYAKHRSMERIPLTISGGKTLALSPGEHNLLIKDVIEQFGPRFAPGSEVYYVGDTGSKFIHFDREAFASLGLVFDEHGKFPDIVLYFRQRKWLLLIESVTSHGPVNAKRHLELSRLFEASTVGVVFVTAFPTRSTMAKYLSDISWETEVWVADSPTHLIHFNGERFLGPYKK
ncbi:MAG: restriction endonuclease [bacterium]|nr:restriction endonuclease [bacterium]